MKKMKNLVVLAASVAVMTCCSTEDPIEDYTNNESWNNGANMPGGNMPDSNGSSATTGTLATFDVAIDKTTAEPTAVAAEYFPDEEDALENNEFTTEVSIDLSNPEEKTENGVEVTVNVVSGRNGFSPILNHSVSVSRHRPSSPCSRPSAYGASYGAGSGVTEGTEALARVSLSCTGSPPLIDR